MKTKVKKEKQLGKTKNAQHISNMILAATVEAMVLFAGLGMIYKGYTSYPGIQFMPIVMYTLMALSIATTAYCGYLISQKKKEPLIHLAVLSVFVAAISGLIKFGPNTVQAIYIAAIASLIYMMVEYTALFAMSGKKRRNM